LVDDFKSIWFNGVWNEITAVLNRNERTSISRIGVETPFKLDICQFRVRDMNEYGLDICGTNMKLFELNNI
jgi:hypothetical protein